MQKSKNYKYFCINTVTIWHVYLTEIFLNASIRSGNELLFRILTWLQQRKQKFFRTGWRYIYIVRSLEIDPRGDEMSIYEKEGGRSPVYMRG